MKKVNHKNYKRKNPLLGLAGTMSEQEADDFLNSIYEDKYNKKCAKCNRQLYNHYPDLRSQFPILKTQLNGHDLIYLDSAATSQKPQEVLDEINAFYTYHNASSHSVHSLGGKVTEMVEDTRQVVADFIGSSVDEVVFTSGATDGINLIANGFLEVSLRGDLDVGSSIKKTPVSLETASPLARGNLDLTLSAEKSTPSASLPPLKRGIAHLSLNNHNPFYLTKDSEILICVDQHHSNILPWQRLAELVGCKIVFFGILADGRWDMLDFESKLSMNTKVIAISTVSNVLGVVQDVWEMNTILEKRFCTEMTINNQNKKLKSKTEQTPVSLETASSLARGNLDLTLSHSGMGSFATLKMTDCFCKPIIVLDATQAVSHFAVDVKELDVDFLVFSGHKIYGPTGVGVLFGKKELLEVLPNYKVGGDMVESVSLVSNIYKESPFRFEAGTANFASIIGLKATLDWFIRSREEIFKVENQLFRYLVKRLDEIEGLEILGGVEDFTNPRQALPATLFARGNLGLTKSHSGTGSFAMLKMTATFNGKYHSGELDRISLISFNIKGVNSLDLALLLDQKGICIRSGKHCAGILHEFLGINSSCRISLACFNTFEEIDNTVECIKNAIIVLK
jgi:cysteine desulfurase / selenocysteine lyase